MYRSFYLASLKARTAFRLRIVCAVYFDHPSVRVLHASGTGHEIRVHQPYLIAGEKPVIFLRRLLHKIFPFDIKLSSERNPPFAKIGIFKIIVYVKKLRPSLRIIVDYQLYRIEHRHHTGTLEL